MMNKPVFSRLLLCSLVLNLALVVVAAYLGLRQQDIQAAVEVSREQQERSRQELLALKVEQQALLTAESSQLAQLQEQSRLLAEQAQQLALYRQVLAPNEGPELLLAQEEIMAQGEPGRFSYRLVLLQPGSAGTRVTGTARLRIRALQGGNTVILDEDALGVAPVTLDFRHFQVLSGSLALPVETRAQTLELQLELDDRSNRILSLNWPNPDNT